MGKIEDVSDVIDTLAKAIQLPVKFIMPKLDFNFNLHSHFSVGDVLQISSLWSIRLYGYDNSPIRKLAIFLFADDSLVMLFVEGKIETYAHMSILIEKIEC